MGVVVDVIPAGNDLLEVKLNQSQAAVAPDEQPDKPSTEAVKAGKKQISTITQASWF